MFILDSNKTKSIVKGNIANTGKTLYNNTESEVGLNGEANRQGISGYNETMRWKDQRGNTTNIENTERETGGTRIGKGNVSEEQSIESIYKDNKTILKTIEYAKK